VPLRLALVDDHPTLLQGLAGIFASDPSFSLVATGGSAPDAVAIVREHKPDVIIVDLSMPGDVFAAIAEMSRLDPQLKLVVFTAFSNVELALKTMDAGAHAFVMKGGAADDLFDAIDAVRNGEIYVSPEFARAVRTGLKNRTRLHAASSVTLTTRERQLVDGIMQARTDAEIGRTLGLTERMVGHYMTGLKIKLHVRSRQEIIGAVQQLDQTRAPS
jgi:two-component system nitrate/nitrite response regulator NarL